ncbi:hypothetical protein, partial [Streptomyces prasinopilosus]|uniref:hypothetical protein n=1 Tax=Streptomyces prasinopilosus TaxID=67344 RepID=UPI0019D031BB
MRAQQKATGGPGGGAATAASGRSAAPTALPATAPAPLAASAPLDRRGLLALQRTAGNAAASLVMRDVQRARAGGAVLDPPAPLPPVEHERVLPPYLKDLRAGGLSFTSGLTGHGFVRDEVARAAGDTGEADRIGAELAARPESFFGQGRSFVVRGRGGVRDVTVRVVPGAADAPGTFLAADAPRATADGRAAALGADAVAAETEGADIKVDSLRNSAGTGNSGTHRTGNAGFRAAGRALWPVAPAVWAGVEAAGDAGVTSATGNHTATTVSEPRTLRSDGGSVEVERHVRFHVRVARGAHDRTPHTASGPGTLTQRVPREHLVPAGTGSPAHAAPLAADTAHEVALADSLAPLAVTDAGTPHAGGGGLYDKVASVLHPRLTAPGAPGRPHLYEATSAATLTEDLPRLLAGWVMGEDLTSADGEVKGSYRMRAEVLSMAPAWGIGRTQLRTHQQSALTVSGTRAEGGSAHAGAGPALAFGGPSVGQVLRLSQLTAAGASRSRAVKDERAATTRQGAEVRGEKALYRGLFRLTVEGTGARAATGPRTAAHDVDVMVSMRAEEAQALGLPLPEGVAGGDLVRTTDEAGDPLPERALPFGGRGASVALGRFDAAPLLRAVERLFATDPRLAGYLPREFGGAAPLAPPLADDAAEQQRTNYRNLLAVLSQTNIRANKDQLLSTGIPVRLRRKSALHAHDVQVTVTGSLGPVDYLGETSDWLVRSSSGTGGSSQTGQSSARSVSSRVGVQLQLVPGVVSAGASRTWGLTSGRSVQAGPSVRGDSLNSGQPERSSFGATLDLAVRVTKVTRERKALRTISPGMPGRHEPEAETIASSSGAADGDPLRLETQDVRLTTPTGFTVDPGRAGRIRDRAAQVRPRHREVESAGIGALTGGAPVARGRQVRDWQFVETVGDARAVRDLAYRLLSEAAAPDRPDNALAVEGLAPRQAIESQLGPGAVKAALRQAVGTGWVVDDLRYPRRIQGLKGAVGTRFALVHPRVVTTAKGPGTENMALGGHQASGQKSRTVSQSTAYGLSGRETGDGFQIGESAFHGRTSHRRTVEGAATTGTVERNSVVPRGRDFHLVQCDLLVHMVAEVTTGLSGTKVRAAEQTVPGAVGVWLTGEQLAAAGLSAPGAPAPGSASALASASAPAGGSSAAGDRAPLAGEETAPAPPPPPVLGERLPLGFGLVEDMPDLVPLLGELRGRLPRSLARELLPDRQTDDEYRNVQRLLRVLDRDGAVGLLSGAMDGGVAVELFRDRLRRYRAVLTVRRTGDAEPGGRADGDRDMEFATVAVADRAKGTEQATSTGLSGSVTGAGEPGGGGVRSTGGMLGAGFGSAAATRSGETIRTQAGIRTIVDASAPAVRMRVPIDVELALHCPDGTVHRASMNGRHLVYRALEKDLTALSRLRDVSAPAAGHGLRRVAEPPERQRTWRAQGAKLPMETQVNGFHGASELRTAIDRTVRAARGGAGFEGPALSHAAYAQAEAVSSEWLMAALPLLTSAGCDLPTGHLSGWEGQDLSTSLHARLRNGRVLGTGDIAI